MLINSLFYNLSMLYFSLGSLILVAADGGGFDLPEIAVDYLSGASVSPTSPSVTSRVGFAGLPVPLAQASVPKFGAEHTILELGAAKPVPISGDSDNEAASAFRPLAAAATSSDGSALHLPKVNPKTGRLSGSLTEYVTHSLQHNSATRRAGRSTEHEQVLIQIARVFDETNRLHSEANRIQAERLARRKQELRAQRKKQAADQLANERADRFNRCTAVAGTVIGLVGTGLSLLSFYWQLESNTNQ